MPSTPNLISGPVLLRPWGESDFARLLEILSDPLTMKFWPQPYDATGVRVWFEKARVNYEDGVGRMAVVLRETGEIVGDAGLNPLDYEGQEGLDIGWIIHDPFQRQGLGFVAARLLLRYAIDELRHPLVIANMPDHHTGSWRIAEKLGMAWQKTIPNPLNRNIPTRWYTYRQEL